MCQYGNIGPLRIFARQRILDSPRIPIGEYIERAVFFGCILHYSYTPAADEIVTITSDIRSFYVTVKEKDGAFLKSTLATADIYRPDV